jgi:transcriptional regulator with XRE-family HTH domain
MENAAAFSNGLSMATLGARVRALRRIRGFAIERLAVESGVSRSMVSEVERGAKMPSILVLDRLATALGTSIARLLDEPDRDTVRVLRHGEQRVVTDPSGWQRRILSPVLPGVEFEFMRTTIEPGVDAGEFLPHPPNSREYVAIEAGRLRLTIDDVAVLLAAGDAVYFPGDHRHAFANEGADPCVYYLAMELGTAANTHHEKIHLPDAKETNHG